MRKVIGFAIALGTSAALVGCGSQSAQSYSSELSGEVRKPRADGPDFGAYKRTGPTPGASGPKTLPKGN